MSVLVAQLCRTLCNPMDCRPPGSSVQGILQGRESEWVTMPFSRAMFLTQGSNLGRLHCRQNFLPAELPGKPYTDVKYMDCLRQELFKNKLSVFSFKLPCASLPP